MSDGLFGSRQLKHPDVWEVFSRVNICNHQGSNSGNVLLVRLVTVTTSNDSATLIVDSRVQISSTSEKSLEMPLRMQGRPCIVFKDRVASN